MAWTDTCKIEARNTVEKKAEEGGMSIRAACKLVSEESDIPAETLRSWCKKSDEEQVGENPTDSREGGGRLPGKADETPTQGEVWASVARRLGTLRKFMAKNCEIPVEIDPDVRAVISERVHFIEEALAGGDDG